MNTAPLSDLYKKYLAVREEHSTLPASQAIKWAKSKRDRKARIIDSEESATFVRDGFTVTVKLKPDDDPDTSTYGEFKRAAELGFTRQLEVHNGEWWYRTDYSLSTRGDLYGRGNDPDSYVYFNDDTLKFDEQYSYYRTKGMARSVARERAMANFKRSAEILRRIWDNDISFVGIVVTVELDGEEYGDASCWGFDFFSWRESGDYINESAEELVDEALDNAKKQLGDEEAALLVKCNETVSFILDEADKLDDSLDIIYTEQEIATLAHKLFEREWHEQHPSLGKEVA